MSQQYRIESLCRSLTEMTVRGVDSKPAGSLFAWLLGLAIVVALTFVSFAAHAGPRAEAACEFGAISAIGPVDQNGNGDTTPEIRCLP